MDETTSETKKNIIKVVVGVALLALVLAGFYYWRGAKKAPEPGASKALEEIESSAPDVSVPTSPVEGKIPSVNPVEEANPFKYKNPLR